MAAIKVILNTSFVQKRAAAAGVMSIAAINTTPTACIPVTTASTVNEVSSRSSAFTGSPKALA